MDNDDLNMFGSLVPKRLAEALKDENLRLRSEVDGLKANNAMLSVTNQRLSEAHSGLLANFWSMHEAYFKLKADLERLTKLPKMDPENYGGKFGVRDNY